jgi:hypothetical protein
VEGSNVALRRAGRSSSFVLAEPTGDEIAYLEHGFVGTLAGGVDA